MESQSEEEKKLESLLAQLNQFRSQDDKCSDDTGQNDSLTSDILASTPKQESLFKPTMTPLIATATPSHTEQEPGISSSSAERKLSLSSPTATANVNEAERRMKEMLAELEWIKEQGNTDGDHDDDPSIGPVNTNIDPSTFRTGDDVSSVGSKSASSKYFRSSANTSMHTRSKSPLALFQMEEAAAAASEGPDNYDKQQKIMEDADAKLQMLLISNSNNRTHASVNSTAGSGSNRSITVTSKSSSNNKQSKSRISNSNAPIEETNAINAAVLESQKMALEAQMLIDSFEKGGHPDLSPEVDTYENSVISDPSTFNNDINAASQSRSATSFAPPRSPTTQPKKEEDENWKTHWSDEHDCEYYHNTLTGEVRWDNPNKKKDHIPKEDEEEYAPISDFTKSAVASAIPASRSITTNTKDKNNTDEYVAVSDFTNTSKSTEANQKQSNNVWKSYWSSEHDCEYYHNTLTGEVRWDNPIANYDGQATSSAANVVNQNDEDYTPISDFTKSAKKKATSLSEMEEDNDSAPIADFTQTKTTAPMSSSAVKEHEDDYTPVADFTKRKKNSSSSASFQQMQQWETHWSDEHGCEYYYNSVTGETRWDNPSNKSKESFIVSEEEEDYVPISDFTRKGFDQEQQQLEDDEDDFDEEDYNEDDEPTVSGAVLAYRRKARLQRKRRRQKILKNASVIGLALVFCYICYLVWNSTQQAQSTEGEDRDDENMSRILGIKDGVSGEDSRNGNGLEDEIIREVTDKTEEAILMQEQLHKAWEDDMNTIGEAEEEVKDIINEINENIERDYSHEDMQDGNGNNYGEPHNNVDEKVKNQSSKEGVNEIVVEVNTIEMKSEINEIYVDGIEDKPESEVEEILTINDKQGLKGVAHSEGKNLGEIAEGPILLHDLQYNSKRNDLRNEVKVELTAEETPETNYPSNNEDITDVAEKEVSESADLLIESELLENNEIDIYDHEIELDLKKVQDDAEDVSEISESFINNGLHENIVTGGNEHDTESKLKKHQDETEKEETESAELFIDSGLYENNVFDDHEKESESKKVQNDHNINKDNDRYTNGFENEVKVEMAVEEMLEMNNEVEEAEEETSEIAESLVNNELHENNGVDEFDSEIELELRKVRDGDGNNDDDDISTVEVERLDTNMNEEVHKGAEKAIAKVDEYHEFEEPGKEIKVLNDNNEDETGNVGFVGRLTVTMDNALESSFQEYHSEVPEFEGDVEPDHGIQARNDQLDNNDFQQIEEKAEGEESKGEVGNRMEENDGELDHENNEGETNDNMQVNYMKQIQDTIHGEVQRHDDIVDDVIERGMPTDNFSEVESNLVDKQGEDDLKDDGNFKKNDDDESDQKSVLELHEDALLKESENQSEEENIFSKSDYLNDLDATNDNENMESNKKNEHYRSKDTYEEDEENADKLEMFFEIESADINRLPNIVTTTNKINDYENTESHSKFDGDTNEGVHEEEIKVMDIHKPSSEFESPDVNVLLDKVTTISKINDNEGLKSKTKNDYHINGDNYEEESRVMEKTETSLEFEAAADAPTLSDAIFSISKKVQSLESKLDISLSQKSVTSDLLAPMALSGIGSRFKSEDFDRLEERLNKLEATLRNIEDRVSGEVVEAIVKAAIEQMIQRNDKNKLNETTEENSKSVGGKLLLGLETSNEKELDKAIQPLNPPPLVSESDDLGTNEKKSASVVNENSITFNNEDAATFLQSTPMQATSEKCYVEEKNIMEEEQFTRTQELFPPTKIESPGFIQRTGCKCRTQTSEFQEDKWINCCTGGRGMELKDLSQTDVTSERSKMGNYETKSDVSVGKKHLKMPSMRVQFALISENIIKKKVALRKKLCSFVLETSDNCFKENSNKTKQFSPEKSKKLDIPIPEVKSFVRKRICDLANNLSDKCQGGFENVNKISAKEKKPNTNIYMAHFISDDHVLIEEKYFAKSK